MKSLTKAQWENEVKKNLSETDSAIAELNEIKELLNQFKSALSSVTYNDAKTNSEAYIEADNKCHEIVDKINNFSYVALK